MTRKLNWRLRQPTPSGARVQQQTMIGMITHTVPAALACKRYLLLLSCLASCTGSPATLAMRPDFEVMTPAGVASVSIREAPLGMTDGEFTQLVRAGMKRAAYRSITTGWVGPPYPSQRIVWHVNLSVPHSVSQLVVNVFDEAYPYALEEGRISTDASPAMIASVVESMSDRLFGDMVTKTNTRKQADRDIPRN
jgi:hypothetical protein